MAKHIFIKSLLLPCLFLVMSLCSCSSKKDHYMIGISQCSDDAWRQQMNSEVIRETMFYQNVDVEILSADDDSRRQIEDIRYFIDRKVDLLIVSPNESEAITEVVEQAYDEGIPVVLVDRKISSDRYTAFIGADNYELGRQVGLYVASAMKGKVVEFTGAKTSSPAVERSRGFSEAVGESGNVEFVASVDAGWSEARAAHLMDSILSVYPDISVVFAHNDRMAASARAAGNAAGHENIAYIGIDALSGEGNGIDMVNKGILNASFIYPTGGDRLMRLAMSILEDGVYEREVQLTTALVDSGNARTMQMQSAVIEDLDGKIEVLRYKMDEYLARDSLQQMLLVACMVIVVLLSVLVFLGIAAIRSKTKANEKLANANEELSRQKMQIERQRDQASELSRRLEEATSAKLAFFTNVSHDFRTPLTLIADPVNQLRHSSSLGEHERFLLNIVYKNVTVLMRLVEQILDFRKFENGNLTLNLSEFRLDNEIEEWIEAFRSMSFLKHIDCRLEVDREFGDYVMVADVEKMERIIYNLLSNAFKFTPENGSISVRLSQKPGKGGSMDLKLSVSDTGIGISAEHIRHIFESFYQVGVHHSGSGIGLALVKAFVEMHDGKIDVSSEMSRGTTFTITMPMTRHGELAEPVKTAAIGTLRDGAVFDASSETVSPVLLPDEEISGSKRTVLLIDDNKDVRDYLKSILHEDFNVIEASNGQDGIRQAMKFVPDAIICDVMMPVMDGMECCRKLKTEVQTSHIPVIMLTAYSVEDQKIKGYECGADSYISKPFSSGLLLARLENLLENHARLESVFSDATSPHSHMAEADKGFLEKLRAFVERRHNDPALTVEEIGEKLGLSRVQLYRKTKVLTGYSPNEFLRIYRLKKAASLLGSTDKTISEVAYAAGFTSPSYFTKCYKAYFGEIPTEFLKRK